MAERFASPTRVHRSKRLTVAVVTALALALAARTTRTSLEWLDRPFPGFVLLEDRVLAAIGLPGWSSATVPDLYLTQVTDVDGRPVTEEAEIYAHAATKPVGTPVRYRVRRGDAEREVTLATGRFAMRDWVFLFGAYLL